MAPILPYWSWRHRSHLKIPPFPASCYRPEEGEADRSPLRRRHLDVHVVMAGIDGRGVRVLGALPFVAGPPQPERGGRLEPQGASGRYRAYLPVECPDLLPRHRPAGAVTVGAGRDQADDLAVRGGAHQLDVLGMRPGQRHGASGRAADAPAGPGTIRQRPHLLGQQARLRGKPLHGPDERPYVAPGRQLVVPPLSREQRPGMSVSPSLIGPAIFPLPVAVVVVASPAGAERGVYPEDRVHHAE